MAEHCGRSRPQEVAPPAVTRYDGCSNKPPLPGSPPQIASTLQVLSPTGARSFHVHHHSESQFHLSHHRSFSTIDRGNVRDYHNVVKNVLECGLTSFCG